MGKPNPAYQVGQAVRVVAGDRDNTPRRGTIREIVWHHKDQRYLFFITESGKKVSKRCFAEDLEADDAETEAAR